MLKNVLQISGLGQEDLCQILHFMCSIFYKTARENLLKKK